MKYKLANGNTLEMIQDSDPMNPRTEFDNLGTMMCFHNRYELGDKLPVYERSMFSSWNDMKVKLIKWFDPAVILPIYMYDHSGLTIKTTPFSCPWDSGQIGYIFISKKKAREEYSCKRISPKLREKITSYLISEVEVYDQYLTGDVWGFRTLDKEGNEIDSCYGFFGSDPKTNGIEENCGSKILEEIFV